MKKIFDFLVILNEIIKEKTYFRRRAVLEKYFNRKLAYKCRLHGKVRLSSPPYLPVEPKIMGNGIVEIGKGNAFSGEIELVCSKNYYENALLKIGDNNFFGHFNSIRCIQNIQIGNDCFFASFVRVSDNNGHPINPADRHKSGSTIPLNEIKPVVIENNVWIGELAVILSGVRIGENSIVSAGSVVTKDVPKNSIVMGVPARKIMWT